MPQEFQEVYTGHICNREPSSIPSDVTDQVCKVYWRMCGYRGDIIPASFYEANFPRGLEPRLLVAYLYAIIFPKEQWSSLVNEVWERNYNL